MTIALAAVGAALATLLLTLLVLWIRQRGRKDQVAEAVGELEARMDAMVRELTDTIERTQHEGQRTRMLGELAGSIDLDEVLNRVLEAPGAIDGVALSWQHRPSAVRLTGVELGSKGSISTTQPKRLASFGSLSMLKRST